MGNDRFQVVDSPSALPGCCFICGSADREFYLDCPDMYVEPDMNYTFAGAFYICNECFMEMARLLNLVSPADIEELKRNVEFLEKEQYELRVEIDHLRKACEHLASVSSVSLSSDDVSYLQFPTDSSILKDAAREQRERQAELSESVSESGSGEGETPEPPEHEDVGRFRTGSGLIGDGPEPDEFDLGL